MERRDGAPVLRAARRSSQGRGRAGHRRHRRRPSVLPGHGHGRARADRRRRRDRARRAGGPMHYALEHPEADDRRHQRRVRRHRSDPGAVLRPAVRGAGARMSTSFTRRGLGAEYGTSWMLPRLIGVERALDLLLSGRTFDAEEAQAMGLVGRLCDPADVLAMQHRRMRRSSRGSRRRAPWRPCATRCTRTSTTTSRRRGSGPSGSCSA